MQTDTNTEETEITLSETTSKALIGALDATIKTSLGVAKALRDCFTELLPALPWKDGKCTLTGAKATKALPEVQSATKVINDMLLKHDRFTVEGEKADTVKLSDSIRNQIGQAKNALGLPKRKIDRSAGAAARKAEKARLEAEAKAKANGGDATMSAEAASVILTTAAQMERASWSPDIIRHELAQCLIALASLQAGHDAVIEHVNRALQEAGCGELAIVAKPKAAPEKAVNKEDRKEMMRRLNEMKDLEDRLAAG
jgi:predicted CoA-binding protein